MCIRDSDDENSADEADAAVTITVTIAAEATTEATEQEDDKDDDKNEPERHGLFPLTTAPS